MRIIKWVGLGVIVLTALASIRTEASHAGDVPREPAVCATGGLDTEDAFCGKCGDGFCSKTCGENALSCPQDCGVVES